MNIEVNKRTWISRVLIVLVVIALIFPLSLGNIYAEDTEPTPTLNINGSQIPYSVENYPRDTTEMVVMNLTSEQVSAVFNSNSDTVLVSTKPLYSWLVASQVTFEAFTSDIPDKDIVIELPTNLRVTIPAELIAEHFPLNQEITIRTFCRDTKAEAFDFEIFANGRKLDIYEYENPFAANLPIYAELNTLEEAERFVLKDKETFGLHTRALATSKTMMHCKFYSPGKYQTMANNSGKFTDVPVWAVQPVKAMRTRAVVMGVSDNRFNPNGEVTREQFATMMMRYFNLDYSSIQITDQKFADDASISSFAKDDVYAAYSLGLINGTGNGNFSPLDRITREDMFAIADRASKAFSAYNTQPGTAQPSFKDMNSVSEYAIEAITAMYNVGMIKGDDNGFVNPKSSASRAEATQVLYNLMKVDLKW